MQRHAHAQQATIAIACSATTVTLRLRDDGRGFDTAHYAEQPHPGSGGYGLNGIAERVALAGGSSTVTSTPGAGTTLLVTVPLAGTGQNQRREPAEGRP